MTNDETTADRNIRSEPSGPHWVAWIPDAGGKPMQSVVLVGRTREEAEEKAKRWRTEQARGPV